MIKRKPSRAADKLRPIVGLFGRTWRVEKIVQESPKRKVFDPMCDLPAKSYTSRMVITMSRRSKDTKLMRLIRESSTNMGLAALQAYYKANKQPCGSSASPQK